MKYYLSIILFFFIFKTSISQVTTFEFERINNNDESVLDVKEDEFGNLYCVGYSRKPESYHLDGIVLKLDPYGNITDSVKYSIDDKSILIYQIIQDSVGTFNIIAGISDTTSDLLHSELLIKRINYSLEELESKDYFISEDRSFGLIYTNLGFNKDLLISSGLWSRVNTPPVKIFNIRLNKDFDSIHSVIKTSAGSGLALKQLSDTTYWNLVEGYVFRTMDTMFNTIESSISKKPIMSPVGMLWDTDTSFYLCGQWINNNDDKDIGIIRQFHPIDTLNSLFGSWGNIDTVNLPASRGGALDFYNKDSIYIGGTVNFQPGWPFTESYFSLIQIDSILNVRWERFYGGDMFYEMNDVLATNDGGCLMSGVVFDPSYGKNKHDIIVIKVDSDGLITSISDYLAISFTEAIVFPNPGKSVINIRVASQYKESKFELFEVNGTKVMSKELFEQQNTINTEGLKSGSYIYQINNDKGLKESGIWIKK